MRLLVLTPEFPPHAAGGLLKYYTVMTAAWAAAGAHVTVLVATPYSEFDNYERGGVRVVSVPLRDVHAAAERLPHLAAAPLLRRWLGAGLAAAEWIRARTDAFDVIEATDFGLLFVPVVLMAGRPPVVVRMHGSLGQISLREPAAPATELDLALARLAEAAILPLADALHALSPLNAAEWQRRIEQPVRFLPPGLPLPPLPDPRLGAQGRRWDGVVVGRIQAWKGPEILCRALEEPGGERLRSLTLAWIGRDTASGPGGGSMAKYLEARYPGIWGGRIVPLGQRAPEEVATLQAAASCVVVPSLWDTFNFTVAEAMALGCVVIVSRGAGASYLVEHGRNGLCFDPGDHRSLAALLVEAAQMSQAARREMGAAARETIARELDPERAGALALEALREVSAAPRQAAAPNEWIRDFFQPHGSRIVDRGYLENTSIRELASHLTARVARRLIR